MNKWSDEANDETPLADHRNCYKAEKWTKAGWVERMLYAAGSLAKAQQVLRRPSSTGRAFG
jgi:hypothetical protein